MAHALEWGPGKERDALALAASPSPGSGGPSPALLGASGPQVYDPTEPAKPWKSTGDSASSSYSTFLHERDLARKENFSLCRKMVIFFIFLILFTAVMLHQQGTAPARLADHIKATLSAGPVQLADVSSTTTLYDYIERTFIPSILGETIDRTLAEQMEGPLVPFDLSNRLLGTVRVRQKRVDYKDNCQLSPMFQTYTVSCYPPFEDSTEAVADFGSNGAVYSFSTDEKGTNLAGKFGTYAPSGYMQLLPTNATNALAAISDLRNGNYLGAATRAVFLEYNVWSSNVAKYANVMVIFEFGATGSVRQEVSVLTLSQSDLGPGGLGSVTEWLEFIGEVLVMVFNIYFMLEELQEIWVSRLEYFLDAWNVLDWINMIVMAVAFTMTISNFIAANNANIGQRALVDSMSFENLRGIAYTAQVVSLLHAVNGLLLWGKAIKYFRYLPLLREIIRVVWNAFDLFLPFICMFSVAFIGFAMAYNIGFGDKIWELSTFYSSVVYLGRAFLRDINLMTVYDLATPMFAATLILLYYVTLILVGASFLFAIIADALFRARFTAGGEKPNPYHRDEPCEEFFRYLAGCCPRRRGRGVAAAAHSSGGGGGDGGNPARDKERAALAISGGLGGTQRGAPGTGGWRERKKAAALVDANGSPPALGDGSRSDTASTASSARGSFTGQFGPGVVGLPARGELMRAVELMSGRILSEIAIVSIEIRSELHEVCEGVAQMQMAVEELTHRAEKVRVEQEMDMT